MMILKLMKIMKKGGEVTVTSLVVDERMSQEAANLVLFMPAMLLCSLCISVIELKKELSDDILKTIR